MKTIHLNRHAKSSWKDAGLRDHDRPLNKRGRINAPFMAERFAESHPVDAIISSSATRALETAIAFSKAMGWKKDRVIIEPAIYGAGIREMMDLILSLDTSWESVIFFGHNPTFSSLANHLDHSFNDYLVTCARASLTFDVDEWSSVFRDSGQVIEHIYPRQFPEMENL